MGLLADPCLLLAAIHPQSLGARPQILVLIRRQGIDEESLASIGTYFIPGGSFGNGGAMRIAPLGLVYRCGRSPQFVWHVCELKQSCR